MNIFATFQLTVEGEIIQTSASGASRTLRELTITKGADGVTMLKTVEPTREILGKEFERTGFGVETVEIETTLLRKGASLPVQTPAPDTTEPVPVAVDTQAAADMAGIIPGTPFTETAV